MFAKGFRYRLHVRKLPGSPDIVFPKYDAVVFVHGCFWHRHDNCRYTTTPRTNEVFWQQKFRENIERDQRHARELRTQGWRLAIIWECALKHAPQETAEILESWLLGNDETLTVGQETTTVLEQ